MVTDAAATAAGCQVESGRLAGPWTMLDATLDGIFIIDNSKFFLFFCTEVKTNSRCQLVPSFFFTAFAPHSRSSE